MYIVALAIWIILLIVYLIFLNHTFNKFDEPLEIHTMYHIRERPNVIPPIPERINLTALFTSDNQNVHESGVRSEIWNKFYILLDDAREDMKLLGESWFTTLQENTIAEFSNYANSLEQNEKDKMLILLNRICKEDTIISTRNVIQTELEVFTLVWSRFNRYNLDIGTLKFQLLDCFESETSLVCITGRISRYINALSALDKNPEIAKPEITQRVLTQIALDKIKVYYDYYFNKNPQYAVIRDSDSNSEDAETRFDSFMQRIRDRIKKKIVKEFPNLESNWLNEAVAAL